MSSLPQKKGKGGRKPGSLNKKTLAALAITEGCMGLVEREIPKVIEALVVQAKDGDTAAAKLLLEQFTIKAKEHAALVEGHNPTGSGGGRSQGLTLNISVVGSNKSEEKPVEAEVIEHG